jgi:hypothetical protein
MVLTREEVIEAAKAKKASHEDKEAEYIRIKYTPSAFDLMNINDAIEKYFSLKVNNATDICVYKEKGNKRVLKFKLNGFQFKYVHGYTCFWGGYEYPGDMYVLRKKPLFGIKKWVRPYTTEGFLHLVEKGVI